VIPICPCQTDVEIPGPHIASCPWSDPDYLPPHWHERAAAMAEIARADLQFELEEFTTEEPKP
jgi:hypothetical protein